MKKICTFTLISLLLLSLLGCNTVGKETSSTTESNNTKEEAVSTTDFSSTNGETENTTDFSNTGEETTNTTDSEEPNVSAEFSTIPFLDINEGDSKPPIEEIRSAIEAIPCDKYECYPSLQIAPVSATLYKDGEVISIGINDPRLIRLINFFNNALHHDKCAYILAFLSEDYLEENVNNANFRLELKYKPFGSVMPSPYENAPTNYDTAIITGYYSSFYFTLINKNSPITDGKGGIVHPITAATYEPYFNCNITLADFGF